MKLQEVTDKISAKEFLEIPHLIYKDDPDWISPLNNDIEAVFDPEKNHFFKHGVCNRWILKDDKGNRLGRVAAFINNEKAHKYEQPTGGIGFFECINDKEAAFMLFDKARTWLKEQGMEAMDGPINFGENDKYWGLLYEGFKPPSYGMNYNPPYYINLFESYGFEKAYDQYTNFLDVTKPLPKRFTRISDWVMKKPGYTFKHFTMADKENLFKDFQEIYNDAWSSFDSFTPIDMATIKESFRQMQPVMDQKLVWYAYYNDEPAAFILCLPDINQLLKFIDGRMTLWNKLKLFYYKNTVTIDRLRIIIMGCKKRFQNHGVESALIRCLQIEVLPKHTIKGVELAWVGDFNDKMIALHEATGAKRDKVHRTYRYKFMLDDE